MFRALRAFSPSPTSFFSYTFRATEPEQNRYVRLLSRRKWRQHDYLGYQFSPFFLPSLLPFHPLLPFSPPFLSLSLSLSLCLSLPPAPLTHTHTNTHTPQHFWYTRSFPGMIDCSKCCNMRKCPIIRRKGGRGGKKGDRVIKQRKRQVEEAKSVFKK